MLFGIVLALLLSTALGTGYQGADAQSVDRPTFTSNFLHDLFEYTFEVNGTEIFPNETIKQRITENYIESEYSATRLEYDIMGYHINASNAKIHVDPSRIDDNTTRLDLQIYAEQVKVAGSADRYYNRVDLESLYGFYNEETDKVTMRVPFDIVLSYISGLD